MRESLNEDYQTERSSYPEEQIISQNPIEGDKVIPGTKITVDESKAKPLSGKLTVSKAASLCGMNRSILYKHTRKDGFKNVNKF